MIVKVEFVDMPFGYPSRLQRHEVRVLEHFNLTMHPGEVVAAVGLSGHGNISLVNFLLRLYEGTD